MSINLSFDGSTEARGRNGWFRLARGWIYDSTSQGKPSMEVKLYSKKAGYMAPIVLSITHPEELRTLIWGLSKAYTQMLTPPDKETTHVADR